MFTFAETDIRAGANDQSFRRGSAYFEDDAVFDLVQRGNLLTAQVTGSGDEPYQVVVGLPYFVQRALSTIFRTV